MNLTVFDRVIPWSACLSPGQRYICWIGGTGANGPSSSSPFHKISQVQFSIVFNEWSSWWVNNLVNIIGQHFYVISYMMFHPFNSVKEPPQNAKLTLLELIVLNESKDAAACNRWLAARLLVIDEVQMQDRYFPPGKDRWLNSHVLVYHIPLQIATFLGVDNHLLSR